MVTLICDDDAVWRRAVARVLDGNVLHACDIESALTLTEKYKPNVVLLDALLPDGIGWMAIPAIRARSPHTQSVVMTALASREDDLRAVGDEFRAVAYLDKVDGLKPLRLAWHRAFMASLVASVRAKLSQAPRPLELAPPLADSSRRRHVS